MMVVMITVSFPCFFLEVINDGMWHPRLADSISLWFWHTRGPTLTHTLMS